METFSHRESVLLGYSLHSNSSPQNLDIDFHDVFGGPPRRASIQEMRCSFGESIDSFPLRSDDETSSYHHRWSGLIEKPVFGEEGVNRRRYPSDDFFHDIFRGSESLSSSPRKNDRDPFSSTPGSRVLSPARPLPPRASETFASSSLPTQFSLPAKLIKGTDLPIFGSGGRNHPKNKDCISNGISFYSNSPLSRFSNQVQEESRNVASFESSLLLELSHSNTKPKSLEIPDEIDKSSNLTKDSNCSEATTVGHQFHFSIYKWASKGVPLAFPFKGRYNSKVKDKSKFERSSSASSRIACVGMAKEFPTGTSHDIDGMSSDAKSCEIELDNKENGSTHVYVVQKQPIEEATLCKSESEIPSTHQEIVKDSPGNVTFQDSKEEKGQTSVATREAPKTKIQTLRSLLLGTDEINVRKELEESKGKSTKKSAAVFDVGKKVGEQKGKRTILNNEESHKANFQGLPTNSRDSPAKIRTGGKVKEFVKIFNKETSDQPNFSENSQSRSSRWKERGKFRMQDDQNVSRTKVNEKVQLPNMNMTSTPDAPIVVDEFLEQYEKHHSQARTSKYKSNISSGLKDSSASTAASIPDGSESMDGHLDDSFSEKILIKELSRDENELQQDGDSQEIGIIDAEIRKWSNGKEGNIRSLLSTLQYVLWPESGWKPVPLVDIIEGNAVKRSYQKALLSLHPDKLQQKGATSHQKYIAQKVFDILQEAWTHFNSLGTV